MASLMVKLIRLSSTSYEQITTIHLNLLNSQVVLLMLNTNELHLVVLYLLVENTGLYVEQ